MNRPLDAALTRLVPPDEASAAGRRRAPRPADQAARRARAPRTARGPAGGHRRRHAATGAGARRRRRVRRRPRRAGPGRHAVAQGGHRPDGGQLPAPAAPPSTCSPTWPAPPSRWSTWGWTPTSRRRPGCARPRSAAAPADLAVEPAMTRGRGAGRPRRRRRGGRRPRRRRGPLPRHRGHGHRQHDAVGGASSPPSRASRRRR